MNKRLGMAESAAKKLSIVSRRLEVAEELINAFIDRTGKIVKESVIMKKSLAEKSRRYSAAEDLLEAALVKLKSTKVETYVQFLIDHDGNFKESKDLLLKAGSIDEVNELSRRLKIESRFVVRSTPAKPTEDHSGSPKTERAELTNKLVAHVSGKKS